MASVTICNDFGAQENKVCHFFHCFPIYLLWSDGTRCHDLLFWMLSFKPTFSLSSFTFIKRFFSSSSLSAMRVVSFLLGTLFSSRYDHLTSFPEFLTATCDHVICLLLVAIKGFLCRPVSKEFACNAGDLGSIPGSGISPGEGNGNPLQYSCLKNPRDRGAQ